MPIFPTYFDGSDRRSGGVLGIPASAASTLPPWLMDAVTALKLGGWPMHSGAPQAALPVQSAVPTNPPPAQSVFDQARAAIPQNLADNADTLLAFGGGTLRGGLGLGASEAAKIGSHAAQLAQQRRALAAQQAAALLALQARGIPDAAVLAAMHPALARVLLTRVAER
jgi:hypothetical protein